MILISVGSYYTISAAGWIVGGLPWVVVLVTRIQKYGLEAQQYLKAVTFGKAHGSVLEELVVMFNLLSVVIVATEQEDKEIIADVLPEARDYINDMQKIVREIDSSLKEASHDQP
jgi:hypothetical protein